MIRIREASPTKLSGLTSLYVSFDFNPEIIPIIKSCEKYVYDKKTYTWELPITNLAYLLDNLTYVDDITLTLQKEDTEQEKLYPILTHEYPPFEHQQEGITYGLQHPTWMLLDDPGMGKTLQMIYLAEELKEQKGLEHCLIICGINTLKGNWKKEIQKYSKLSCRVLGEKINKKGKISYSSIKERAAELMSPMDAFFIITNIESIRSDDVLQALKTTKNKIGMIVLDEAHKCKSPSTQQGAHLLKLTNYEHKIALTGTLIINKPVDAYTALKWIGVEKANLSNFKSQYCIFGGFGGHQIVGYKNLDLLKAEIDSCSLRRRKEDLKDFPPKTIINEIVEMDDLHQKFYEDVKNGIKEECDKIVLNANNVLALSTRLRQATSCPSILTSSEIASSKIVRAIDLVEEICSNGDKVVIMSTFKETLNVLKNMLAEYHPLLGTGDLPDDVVTSNIELFQTDPKYKVFLATTSKCGTGINLNAASYMICIDTPYTAALQEQVEDRINRINNTKPAFIYRLICQNTIDEAVMNILEVKQAISDFIVDDKADAKAIEILRNYVEDL